MKFHKSIKANFSFCWYQFYKFLFIFTNRWRKSVTDLETFCIGMVCSLLNTQDNKSFRVKDLNMKKLDQNFSRYLMIEVLMQCLFQR